MKDAIQHYMWGYQQHFRVSIRLLAERLFGELDQSLRPEVFVVGVLDQPDAQRWPACVEPEDDHWVASEDFDVVVTRAKEIAALYPEAQMFHSHPLAQERETSQLAARGIRDAIREVIERHPRRPNDTTFYVSMPAKVGPYMVSVVLGLSSRAASMYLGHPDSAWIVRARVGAGARMQVRPRRSCGSICGIADGDSGTYAGSNSPTISYPSGVAQSLQAGRRCDMHPSELTPVRRGVSYIGGLPRHCSPVTSIR